MKLSNPSAVPVYTIAGASTARPLPEWLARKRKRSLKKDPEYANRIELLQDFEFEEASSCVRISEDGEWVMSTGKRYTIARGAPVKLKWLIADRMSQQEHTSRRCMCTTYHIYRSHIHGIPTP